MSTWRGCRRAVCAPIAGMCRLCSKIPTARSTRAARSAPRLSRGRSISDWRTPRPCSAPAMEPTLLIADEPVSALDVSVQAQVLKLLDDVRQRFDLAVLFITHDLRVAAQICDRIAVMQRGIVVEQGPTAEVFAAPSHA